MSTITAMIQIGVIYSILVDNQTQKYEKINIISVTIINNGNVTYILF